jgi:hypothetical protein
LHKLLLNLKFLQQVLPLVLQPLQLLPPSGTTYVSTTGEFDTSGTLNNMFIIHFIFTFIFPNCECNKLKVLLCYNTFIELFKENLVRIEVILHYLHSINFCTILCFMFSYVTVRIFYKFIKIWKLFRKLNGFLFSN